MATEEGHDMEEPLIGNGKYSSEEARWLHSSAYQSRDRSSTTPCRRLSLFFLGTVLPWFLLILLGSYTWIQDWRQARHKYDPSSLIYTPVEDLIEYELRYFGTGHEGDPSPYFGDPSPELDEAWDNLYPSLYQLIPQEQAALLFNRTLIFPHDPERRYIVELDVFHQLHCLNMIRQSVHPDYYKGSAPGIVHGHEEDLLFGPRHVAHCIESIRQALMCHVDVTPYTWVWNEVTQSMQNVFATPHTCRNFDKIRDWAAPERNGGRVEAGFDAKYREMNDPLDPKTWVDGYQGE